MTEEQPSNMKQILNENKPPPAYNEATPDPEVPVFVENLRFSPNAVVGKATCIQLKPSGTEVDVLGESGLSDFLTQLRRNGLETVLTLQQITVIPKRESLGTIIWTFCCQSSVLLWIWPMFGDFHIFVTRYF